MRAGSIGNNKGPALQDTFGRKVPVSCTPPKNQSDPRVKDCLRRLQVSQSLTRAVATPVSLAPQLRSEPTLSAEVVDLNECPMIAILRITQPTTHQNVANIRFDIGKSLTLLEHPLGNLIQFLSKQRFVPLRP